MNSNINGKPTKLSKKQRPHKQNFNRKAKPKDTAKHDSVVQSGTGDVLLEYWSGGFRIPAE